MRAIVITAIVAGSLACGPRSDRSDDEMRPVSLPDVSSAHPAIQEQARERYERLQAARRSGAVNQELGTAYGEFGMLLHAAEFLEAAEPAYVNAQALMPADVRWPYYLAHLQKTRGNLGDARAAFARVLEIKPDDLATLIWLGRVYLDLGQVGDAERMFMRASAIAPQAIAVLAGLGRAALAEKDFAAAIRHFEEALALDPSAESLHAPLAAAYRASGALDKAEPHLRQWQNRDILVPDALYQELELLLESGLAYELRGVRALEAKDFTSAAEYFRRGLALTTENTPLRRSLTHKLGTALYAAGQRDAAVTQFLDVVRATPHEAVDEAGAKANYSLGVIAMSSGDGPRAIEYLQSAVRSQPTYVEAHVALAESLRRSGQVVRSLPHYAKSVEINPQNVQARLGYALALIRLGRDREAKAWLTDATTAHPDQPEFPHLLARLLVASPDAVVRDGPRAMALVQELLRGTKTTDLGETLAMTLAELGEYKEAAAIQRGVLQTVRKAGLSAATRRLEGNLRSYESGKPLRSVWAGEDYATPGARE